MTLVQLKHYISLAQTASFGKAASAMHLTQPALELVRALMAELLVDDKRTGRGDGRAAFSPRWAPGSVRCSP